MKEKKNKKQKKERTSTSAYLLFAVTFIALGVCFIGFTSVSIDVMCYSIGGVTVLAAAFNAVLALAGKKRGGGFFIRIILCALAVVCGVVTIVNREGALEYIVAAAAFLLIIESSFKLQLAVRGKALKAPLWWIIVFLVVACYAGTAYLIKFYNPAAPKLMVVILGILLVADGVLNLLTPLYLASISRREKEGEKEAENGTEKGNNTEK